MAKETQYLFEPYGNIVVDKDSEGKVIDKVMVNNKQMCRVVADGNLMYEKHPSWVWKNNSSSSVGLNSYHIGKCTLCGDTQKESHHWSTTPTFQDGVYHRYSCTAKDKEGNQCLKYYDEEHSNFLEYSQSSVTMHQVECSKCNTILGREEHTFPAYTNLGTSGHRSICTKCNYVFEGDHDFQGVKAYRSQYGFTGKCAKCSYTTSIRNWRYRENDIVCNAEDPSLTTTITVWFDGGRLSFQQSGTVQDIVYKAETSGSGSTNTSDVNKNNGWLYFTNNTRWQAPGTLNVYRYKKRFSIPGFHYFDNSYIDRNYSTVLKFLFHYVSATEFEYTGYFRKTLNGSNVRTENKLVFTAGGFSYFDYYSNEAFDSDYLVFPGDTETHYAGLALMNSQDYVVLNI